MSTPLSSPPLGRTADSRSTAQRGAFLFSFHGTGGTFFALMLKNILLTLLTLGIYLPWSKTERRKYLWQNIEIHGHRLRYHGTGKELFFGYVKVILAYAVLVGVPALVGHFVDQRAGLIAQLALALLILPLIPFAIWGSRRYLLSRTSWRGVHLRLEGPAGPYARTFLLGYLGTLLTFGIYGPFWISKLYRMTTNASALGTRRFEYRGSDKELFKICMKGLVLSVLTLGLYMFWFQAELNRYLIRNTWFDGAHGELDLLGLDLLMLTMVQIFGLTFTLGLGFPWVMSFVMRYTFARVRFVGEIDFSRIYQVESHGEAAADGLADALDVGLAI